MLLEVNYRLRPSRKPKFAEDSGSVGLDSLFTDEELVADLGITKTMTH